MSIPKQKPLDWRENLAQLVEYTRRQALATEQLAKELRDIKEIYREGSKGAARRGGFLSDPGDPGEDTT